MQCVKQEISNTVITKQIILLHKYTANYFSRCITLRNIMFNIVVEISLSAANSELLTTMLLNFPQNRQQQIKLEWLNDYENDISSLFL